MVESILKQEIHSQPEVIRNLIKTEKQPIIDLAAALRNRYKYILIAARGSSDNAARYAKYVFQTHNKCQVALATPSVFSIYKSPPDLSCALVIGISQSGQSPDIVSVIKEAARQGCPTLAITNDITSPLAAQSEHVISLHAGQEKAVAATKTYTTSLTALAMLSSALSFDKILFDEITRIPQAIQDTLNGLSGIIERVERYRFMEQCIVIGRGYNYATAFEVSLKIKELSKVVAEPYSSADLLHGPIAAITEGFPVLIIAPEGPMFSDLVQLHQEIKQRNPDTILISNDQGLLAQANLSLPITPQLPDWLSPLITVIPGQLFAMQLATEMGLNPDQPKGLSKITKTT
jgi:glutamine---fructose-6-phosphate transaminase (isomerizing)